MGGTFSMRDASYTTRWVAEASLRLMCGNSDVKIRQTSSWDEERQDILERARWLCSKIIVSPRKLLDQMPKELGEEFGGQWAIYSCSMLMFALGNISKLYPDQKDACIKKMENLLPIVMSEEIRNYDTLMWKEDALKTLDGSKSHMTYLSILAWTISLYKLAGGLSDEYDDIYKQCCEALARRMQLSRDFNLPSFPNGIVFLPDMLVTIVALVNYGKIYDDRYEDAIIRWVEKAKVEWIHKKTGLLIAKYHPSRRSVRTVRGSYSALSCSYLTLVNDDFAKEQYDIFRKVFRQNGKLVGIKEFLNKSPKFLFDYDAGPIINGMSPSGTAFALGAATYFEDWELRSQLLRTADIAGATVKDKNSRHYRLGEIALVGEATVLGMRTNIHNYK